MTATDFRNNNPHLEDKTTYHPYWTDELVEQYANEKAKEELNSLGYFIQGADEDMISDRIDRRIKELSK